MNTNDFSTDEKVVLKAIALCFKEWLKPEEAMILLNLKRTQLAIKCKEYGIFTNRNGYYSRKELDMIISGAPTKYEIQSRKLSQKSMTNPKIRRKSGEQQY